jgi:hypothetical protein
LPATGAAVAALKAAQALAGPASQGSGGTRTRTPGEASAESLRKTLVQLVRTKDYQGDVRYRLLDVHVPPGTPELSPGTAGVVLFATREEEQINLFLPIGGGAKLVCVNAAGDPEKSTTVCDLDGNSEPDPARIAQLHTAWRVVPPAEDACSPRLTPFPILSWQLGLSGQDNHSGTGLFTDNAATSPSAQEDTGQNEERAADEPDTRTEEELRADKIQDLQQRRSKLQQEVARLSQQSAGNPGVDQAAFNREIAARNSELNSIARQLSALGAGGTRTRDPRSGETGARDPKGFDPGILAQANACASARMSGPLEVGRVDDPHRIGLDIDGNPINAGHLGTGSLFLGGPGDGPMNFESARYTNPPRQPNRVPVHLRWDPTTPHEWLCGSVPGVWRWEAESIVFDGVPPITDRQCVLESTGKTVQAGDGGTRTPDKELNTVAGATELGISVGGPIPETGYGALESQLGFPKGAITEGGVTGLTHDEFVQGQAEGRITPGGNPSGAEVLVGDSQQVLQSKLGGACEGCAAISKKLAIQGGLLFKGMATKEGDQDFSQGGFYDCTDLVKAQNAPAAMSASVYMETEDGGWDGFVYDKDPQPGKGGTGQGALVLHAADLTMQDVLDEKTSNVCPVLNLYESKLGFAVPDANTGNVKDGFTVRLNATNDLEFQTLDSDGNVTATATILAGTTGNLGAGGGIGGSTGATDNAILRADGVGGATVQASGVLIDDSDNVCEVEGIKGKNDGTGVTFGHVPTGPATGSALQVVVVTTTQRNNLIGSAGMIVWNTTESRFEGYGLTWDPLGQGDISGNVGATDNVLVTSDGTGGQTIQGVNAARATINDNGQSFFDGNGAFPVPAHILRNRNVVGTSSLVALEIQNTGSSHATPFVYVSFAADNVADPDVWTLIGGGKRTGVTFGEGRFLATTGGTGSGSAICGRFWRGTTLAFLVAESMLGIGALASTPGSVDATFGWLWVDATGGENDEQLIFRDRNGTDCSLMQNKAAGATVVEHTSPDGEATITTEGNQSIVALPGSGSANVTVTTPFIPGSCVELQVVVTSDASGGTLTNVGVGDGTDPNRWGDLTTFTLNSILNRENWTVTTEVQGGFYMTASQAASINIVLTPSGDWGGGEIRIIIHQKASTIITFT